MNKELFPLSSEQHEPKKLKNILSQYTRYWYLFFLGAILSVGAAYFYLHYYAIPQYSVYSTLLIKDDKSGQAMTNADVFNDLEMLKSTRNIDNEIEVLKSKSLMTRVVNELSLSTGYYVEGKVKDRQLYNLESPVKIIINKFDSSAIGKSFTINLKASDDYFTITDNTGSSNRYNFNKPIQKSYGNFSVVKTPGINSAENRIIVRFQDVKQIADHYNKAITVLPANRNASVLTISLVDPIAERAKDVINKLMNVYNIEAVEDKNLMAANTLKFLDERLKYITAELSVVEKGVEKYKSNNGLTDVGTQASNYIEQASGYNMQLSEWAIQMEVLESIESYLKRPNGQYAMMPSTLGIKDETLLLLIEKFNELQLDRARLLRTVQPNSSLILNENEQLINLRSNILENLKNIKRGLQITSDNLRANSGQFQSKIKRVPTMERELDDIKRQQEIKHNIYVYLLRKREETALSLAATVSAARIIDPAMGGDYPISPNTQTIYMMALLLGLGVPFAGIYIGSLLNDKVQTQQDVTNVTAVPIIGEIAHKENNKEILVVNKGNQSPIAEMFRLIRSNLLFSAVSKENIMVLVTSSMSGEGKTFFSINLAASLAVTGKRILLLDLDLRNPKVASDLELSKGPGITDYLISTDLTINDIVKTTEKVPDLFVISSGMVPPNPMELMMTSKFAHLIHELKESFDYIIIDTPPVGQVADTLALSSFADFTLYLVRYNYTNKAQLGIIKNIYNNKSLNSPMIVMNDATETSGNNYGYGYGYGYGYKSNTKAARKEKILK